VLAVLSGFVEELRQAGLPVSLTEHLDAAEAIHHIPLEDREGLKYALGATLVKSQSHWRAFETAFDVYFAHRGAPLNSGIEGLVDETGDVAQGDDRSTFAATGAEGVGARGESGGGGAGGGGGGDGMTAEELAELLYRVLLGGDQAQMRTLARFAVERYAGFESGRPVGGTYYLYRTLRNLDLDGVLERVAAEIHLRGRPDGSREEPGGSTLKERLAVDEYRIKAAKIRAEIEREIRRRLVEDRGAKALARSVRKPIPEEIDVMRATSEELGDLRRALHPLSRKLAVRLARRRRRGRRGPLDFRATIRHSMSSGGVPIDPKFRHPRPSKPEIFVIADISGSVASFARFTLHLVHAISSQFSKVRSFVFIDGLDEVTALFEGSNDPAEAVHRINTEADVVWMDGHSDYGHAFNVFYQRFGDQVTSRTSVLILGDARNNYHASESWVLAELSRQAKHVYWLNPEPRSYWSSGDSIVSDYEPHCDAVVECRTLRQLEKFVGGLS
jgi:hypothetical protein